MDWRIAAISFGLILPVELPDKTFVAALVLSTRYRPLPVWLGVGLAFAIQCTVAVSAGAAVSYLPGWIIHVLSIAMFLVGAVLLLISAPRAAAEEQAAEEEFAARARAAHRGWWRAFSASFLLLFAAEWGDLSQILTLNLAAKYGHALSVFLGAWLALLVVSGAAVIGGRFLLRYVSLSLLHYIAGGLCLAFAALGVVQLATG